MLTVNTLREVIVDSLREVGIEEDRYFSRHATWEFEPDGNTANQPARKTQSGVLYGVHSTVYSKLL